MNDLAEAIKRGGEIVRRTGEEFRLLTELLNPTCDLDADLAIVRVRLSKGCAAFPDAREQNLCPTHWRSIMPRGEMCEIVLYPSLDAWKDTDTPLSRIRLCKEHAA